jgi:hypothetical protein
MLESLEMSLLNKEQWFKAIEEDIEKKYRIKNPIFIVHNKKLSKKNTVDWIELVINQNQCIMYKYLADNDFELKGFYPNRADYICEKFASDLLESIETSPKLLMYKHLIGSSNKKFFYYSYDKTYYTKNQMSKEIFLVFKSKNVGFCWSYDYFVNAISGIELLIIFIYNYEDNLLELISKGFLELECKG